MRAVGAPIARRQACHRHRHGRARHRVLAVLDCAQGSAALRRSRRVHRIAGDGRTVRYWRRRLSSAEGWRTLSEVVDAQARFEAVYRAHAGAVRTYVRRRSDAQTADDVVADVFVVAWRRLDDVPDDPLPWLLGVARRTLANSRRTAARDAALKGRIVFERSADATHERDDAVLRALGMPREADREALLLVGWEGLDPPQAAVVLRVRPNTFSARLSRARRRFARALAAERRQSDEHSRSEDEVVR